MNLCIVCKSPITRSSSNERFCSRTCYLAFPPLIESARFWSRVDKTESCWVWRGKKNVRGYGQFWAAAQRLELAHRTAWRLIRGPIPVGKLALHKCDNPGCVRPDHIFLGTDLDNSADCRAKGRSRSGVGERNGRARLTDAQVEEIRRAYIPGSTRMVDIAREFGISNSHVSQLVNNRQRRLVQEIGSSSGILSFGC